MKIKVVLIFILWIHSFTALTQVNLIPNGGFDNEECLDFDTTFFFHLSFWHLEKWLPNFYYNVEFDTLQQVIVNYDFNVNELYQLKTPDFFFNCNSNLFIYYSYKPNWTGYQQPFSGYGYIGLGCAPSMNYYEYIHIELKDTLKKGQGYCFSMMYSLANHSNRAISHIGVVFSKTDFNLLFSPQNAEIFIEPQIYSDTILCSDLDTVNWRLFERHFIADGGERFLTLGWFHPSFMIQRINTNFPIQDPQGNVGYYYIDVLELIECPQYGVPDYEIIPPNVISPNGDGLNDAFYIHPYLPQPSSLIIYNRWGAEVFRSANYDQTWQGATTDGKPVAEGTYFYVLQLPSGTVKKGTVSVFR